MEKKMWGHQRGKNVKHDRPLPKNNIVHFEYKHTKLKA